MVFDFDNYTRWSICREIKRLWRLV